MNPESIIRAVWFKSPEDIVDQSKIRQIVRELEQISPFKEKKTTVIKVEETSPPIEPNAKVEVLSILRGLEFAGFSDEAKRRAVEVLTSKIEELLGEPFTAETVWKIGLYTIAVELIRKGQLERVKEIERL